MERMGVEYQRFGGKEYVSLRRYYNLLCKCKALGEENRNLKSDLSKFSEAYKKYRDYEKEELAESCYDLARENEKLKEEIAKLEFDIEAWKKLKAVLEEKIRILNEKIGKLVMNK